MRKLALTIFAVTLTTAGAALAADPSPTPSSGGDHHGFRDACGADLKQYCSAATTREERRSCVDANKEKFSEGCKSFMAAHPRHGATPPAGQ